MRRALGADLQAAIDALPETFRQAVWLRDVEEFSYKEIAEILHIAGRHRDVAHFSGASDAVSASY